MEHYRCVKCYFPDSKSTRDADTVEIFPKSIPFLKTTSEDYLLQSASDILAILQSPSKSLPYLQYGDSTKNALLQLSQLIKNAVEQPKLRSESTPTVRPPPIVATPSIVVPPPLAPLPRVEETVIQPPIMAIPTVLPQFQKLSLPVAPRVQMRQPFVPVSKPYHHVDRRQMFFNMPTPKQRFTHPNQLVNRVSYDALQGTLSNMVQTFATYKPNRCLPCLAAIMYTMPQVKKKQ